MTAPVPMLATRVDAPFTRPGWVFEPKYDGWRVLAARRGGRVSLLTRGGLDLAGERPEIARAVAALPGGDLAVDGEMVVLDARGVSSFRLLQARNEAGAKSPLLVLFDCLEADGERSFRGRSPSAGPRSRRSSARSRARPSRSRHASGATGSPPSRRP